MEAVRKRAGNVERQAEKGKKGEKEDGEEGGAGEISRMKAEN